MKLLQLLLVILLSEVVLTAPVREGEGLKGEEQGCSAPGSDEDIIQQEVDDILEQGLLDNAENLDKIKRAFDWDPDTVKICVNINYEINCTNQEECAGCFNCYASNPHTFIWTSFDPTTLAGALLLEYGSVSYDIFGFEWAGACDLSNESTVSLLVSATSLSLLCDVEDGQMYITKSFSKLTIKVSISMIIMGP